MLTIGQEVMARLDKLSQYSSNRQGVTRLPFTDEHKQALDLISKWMADAGLSVHLDDAGTLIGRRNSQHSNQTLLLGSHQDSVPCGGKYDGALGVVLPIVVLETLGKVDLPFNIEVLCFADEEGVRFPTALLGPRALAGTLNPAVLEMHDENGITIRQAITDFGLDPEKIFDLKRNPTDIIGYVETHIEQGPVLQADDLSIGIVSAICGIERWTVKLTGRAAHAGTTPMKLRKDALAGASEIVLEIEQLCQQTEALLGVVGHLQVKPNAVNAIAGEVTFTIELRSGIDNTRIKAGSDIAALINTITQRRDLKSSAVKTYEQPATQCEPNLSNRLLNATKKNSITAPVMVSGATHDASAMADLTCVSMLFTRCLDGISHHPNESIRDQDVDCAAEILKTFILDF